VSDAPAVSVLIKSYNHAAYIAQTIESVLGQTVQDFEILVTDDASTDGTPDVVRRFADPRIKLEVSPVNRGVSLGMRSLFARARGRYVAILNSDDIALPTRLERQLAYLDTHPATAAVFTAARQIGETGRPVAGPSVFDVPLDWPDHGRPRWLRRFFLEGNCLCAPSAMLRPEVLLQVEPHDPRLTNLQDLDLWVRLASRYDIGFIAEPLTAFRIRAHRKNLSADRRDTRLRVAFETSLILEHYAAMPIELIAAIFAAELNGRQLESERAKRQWLAEMALRVPLSSHRLFALRSLFDVAETRADFDRLRLLSGTVDIFNTEFMSHPLRRRTAQLGRGIRRLAATILRAGSPPSPVQPIRP
jgi:glycosyltransferase involved in cell wall biosynthesis